MAGETALARQLSKLAVPQTSLLLQDKIKKSLLFDHREAAALDRDVFFSYGVNGFSKLKAIHPPFEKFQKTLFESSYVAFERGVQTVGVNRKLNRKIIEFLRMVSPYFVLQSSLEALEWLVYRFHIHLYNTDELMASVMPHYNTSTFVRVVQLLSLDTPQHRWGWLKEVQKSGVHLEYGVVLNRFCTDGEFRKLVCDMAQNSFYVFKDSPSTASPVISFSMVTILNSLGRNRKIDDSDITFFFPYILKGLKSQFSKYVSGSYMVIFKIISSVQLKEDLVNDILMKVFEHASSDLSETAFKLLVTVFQRQGLQAISKELFDLLLSVEDFDTHLIYWSANCDCQALVNAVLDLSIPAVLEGKLKGTTSVLSEKLSEFVPNILSSALLTKTTVIQCFNSTLNWYSDLLATGLVKGGHNSVEIFLKDTLKHLEAKYPRFYDEAVSKYFKKGEKGKLMKLVNDSMCNVKSVIVPELKTTLVLGINHAVPDIRRLSIRYLIKLIKAGKVEDSDFIEKSIFERLADDFPIVVSEILNSSQMLFEVMDKMKIIVGFRHVFKQNISEKSPWYPVQRNCLDIICKHFSKDETLMFEILVTILPYIYPLKKQSIIGFKKLLNSQLKDTIPILQAFDSSDLDNLIPESEVTEEQLSNLNFAVFASARKYIEMLDEVSKSIFTSSLLSTEVDESSLAYLTLYVYVVGQAIISFNCLEQKSACLRYLLKFLKSFPCKKVAVSDISMDERALSKHCVESLSKNSFPGLIIYHTLNRIVKFVVLECDLVNTAPWAMKENNSSQASVNFLIMLFEFFIEPASNHKLKNGNILKNILDTFINSQFKTPQYLYAFLSLLWSNALSNVSETIQTAALVSAYSSCKDSISSDSFFNNYALCICLFKAIASSNAEVRTPALTLLSSLLEKSVPSNSPLKYLAEEIKGSSEEISVDHLQIFYVFNSWLSPVADIYGQPNYETILDSDISEDLSKRYSVLDNFMKVLADESTVSSVKCFLLQVMNQTDSVGILKAYLPLIEQFLQRAKESVEQLDKSSIEIFGLLIQKFTPKTASSLKEKSAETDTVFHCLEIVGGEMPVEIQASLFKILSREFFSAIPSVPVQKRLLKDLLKLYVTSTSEASADLKKVLKKLCTFAYLVMKDIHEKKEPEKKGTTLREMKKSRTAEPVNNVNDSMMWKQVTVVLEMIQGKSKLEKREVLVPELFNLLHKTINLDSHSSVEYIKQLILSSIYNCCQHLREGGLDERQFQVELVVQCIRSSTNPKTHHQSLLLLNLAATIFPEYVLNNVMSIFTFMGSSLIRQDDKYSIQVISQTIETIVPSLLAASNSKKENDAMQIVASMIRVFVDSLPDIPTHRQFPLFTKLITTLDPSKYLWIPLAQICDQYEVVFQYILSENVSPTKLSSTLEFAVNFHQQFSPSVQIDTCINMLQFLSQLPDFKEENADYADFTEPFNVANHTNKQLQKYKHNILSYIKIWLSSQTFLDQVSDLDSKSQQGLEEKYELLLEKALHYLQHQRDLKPISDEEEKISLFSLLYALIGYINALLPCTLFIRVVRRLLQNQEPVIKKKAIELLNTKLEEQQHLFSEENHGYLLKLLKPLLKVAKEFEDSEENDTVNQQTALYALHLLTKIIGSEYPKKFQKVLNLTIHVLKDKNAQELRVNALLCLAQLCVSLNVQVLPHLNTFMPVILDLLATFQTLDVDDCLLLGVITALQSLVENLGMFLSIYLQSLVSGVSILYTKYAVGSKGAIQEKLLAFQTLLAKDISLRILLPALEDSYSMLCSQDPDAVIALMNLLEKKLGFSSVTEVESSSSQLQTFYILCLSFRSTHPDSSVETVETSIISALKSFVVKLSVTRFRLFFQKTYQWMAASELKEPQTASLNIFTFYNLTNELSKTLKTLFNPAAKHFLKHAATQLDANNTSKNSKLTSAENPPMTSQLLNNIIDTLNVCFVHDDGLLLDKDSFESLMMPLVDQLENLQGGEAAYQDRVTNHLNTCIAHFMAAVSDNTLWKKLNYQVLMKTRHDLAVVRFAAIRAVREVAVKMGDNYLVLLPESIPFLAEVMEDESAEVERECQTVIEEMEKILGEPIRKYF